MNEEILADLSTIKDLQVVIIILLSFIVLVQVTKILARLYRDWSSNKEHAFIHIASDLYDKGSYQELSEYCTNRMERWAGNPYPIYWQARAQYKLGNLEVAKELFEKVLNMEPEWENSIEPHLDKLKNN